MIENNLGELFYRLVLDSNEFNKSINSSETRMDLFSKKLERVGKEMSTKLTVPLLAFGGAALKAASDAESVGQKFNKAFSTAIAEAGEAVKMLGDNYGYSETQASKLLANTGDLMKGFGATSSQALSLSTRVQQMAKDLALYNNVQGGAEAASQKLTKAMLGETEGLVELGIKLTQADIQTELVRTGQDKLTGQALLLAKANATLTLATEQSQDAMGAYGRSTGTVAGMLDALKKETSDMAKEFGDVIIPAFKSLLGAATGVAKSLGDMGPETKKFVVQMAALVAGAGPAILTIQKLGAAFKVLTGNPWALAISGIIALGAAIAGFNAKVKDQQAIVKDKWTFTPDKDDIEQGKKDLMEIAALTKQYFRDRDAQSKGSAIWQAADAKAQAAAKVVLEYERALNLAIAAEKKANEEKEAAAKVNDLVAASEERKQELIEKYKTVRADVLSILESEKDEYVKISEKIAELEASKWASGALENDRLKAVEILRERQLAILDEREQAERDAIQTAIELENSRIAEQYAIEEAYWKEKQDLYEQERKVRMGLADDIISQFENNGKTELDLLKEQYASVEAIQTDYYDEAADKAKALALLKEQIRIKELDAEEKAADERRKQFIEEFDFYAERANAVLSLFKTISDFQANQDTGRISSIERERDVALNAIDLQIKSIEDLAEIGDITREEAEIQTKQLENAKIKAAYDAEVAKYEIEKNGFERKKKLALAEIALQTSIAIIKGYAELGPVKGTIAALLLGAIGVAQVATVNSQQPPEPPTAPTYLQYGGIVSATPGGTNAVIGEAGDDEAVIPLNDRTFQKLGQAIVDSMNGSVSNRNTAGMNLTIVLEGIGQTTLQLTQDALNSGIIRVPARVVVKG